MTAYCRVYDSHHLQADCQEPGSAPEPYARYLSMDYLYLLRKRLNASEMTDFVSQYCVCRRERRLYEEMFSEQLVSTVCVGEREDESTVRDLLQTAAVIQFIVEQRETQTGERRRPAEKQRSSWRL